MASTIELPLFQRAARTPTEWALADPRTELDWAELADVVLRTATALDADRERAIAICAHNCIEAVIVNAAALLARIPVAPLSWHLTPDELAYILRDCGGGRVFVGPGTLAAVQAAARGLPDVEVIAWRADETDATRFEDWIARPASFVPDPLAQPARNLMYTSGTTGRPKGAISMGRQASATVLDNCLGRLVSARPHMVSGPLYHGGQVNGALHICAGAPVVVLDRFDAETALATIQRYGVGSTTMVPTHFKRLLNLPAEVRSSYDIASMETLIHTGAPCPVEVKEGMIAWFGPILEDRYGGTESGTLCTITAAEWLQHKGSVGRPHEDTEVLVIGEDGALLPPGEVGGLYFRHPSRETPSYRGEAGLAPTARDDGAYTLGEIGYIDQDGYVFLTERSSDLVLSGGVNLYPSEVERVLLADPRVADAVCLGVPHEEMGEELIALVQKAPGDEGLDEADILAICRASLSRVKCPKRVEFTPVTGRNPMGKVNRRRLRALYLAGGPAAIERDTANPGGVSA